MARNYVPIPYEYKTEMALLTDAEFGRLVRALIEYSEAGTLIELSGNERFFAERVMARENRYKESFEGISEQRSRAGKLGGRPRKKQGKSREKADEKQAESRQKAGEKQAKSREKANESKITYTETDTDTDTDTNTESDNVPFYVSNPPATYAEGTDDYTMCAELQRAGPLDSAPAAVISLPLNGGSVRPITQDEIDHWGELYPAVDVMQELRKMMGWIESNPRKKKTPQGIDRFITSWLARTQDQGGNNGFTGGGGSYGSYSRQDSAPQSRLEWSGGALADFA